MANVSVNVSAITINSGNGNYSDVKLDNSLNSVLVDRQAIRNSVSNILRWKPGERILYPNFGNVAYNYLFETITPQSFSTIKSCIQEMLAAEPRIQVTDIQIDSSIDNNEITIAVAYKIIALDESDSVILNIS